MITNYNSMEVVNDNMKALLEYFDGKLPFFFLIQVPLIFTKEHLKMVPQILEQTSDEFCSSILFDAGFVNDVCYEGCLPMATDSDGKYIFLIKLHHNRSILYFNNLHITKKIKKLSSQYYITIDNDFESCILNIKNSHYNNWIVPPLEKVFTEMFYNDKYSTKIHSIELYKSDKLVAGEIGYSIGGSYTSLSGFHLENNTGTIQLCATGKLLEKQGFKYWDLGMDAEYKRHLGAQLVKRYDFLDLIRKVRNVDGIKLECKKTNAQDLINL